MKVDGKTRLLGVVGQNISHTLSPLIHNFAAQALGKNHVYVPFDLPSAAVKSFLQCFWEMGGIGFNVTVPHKQLFASLIPGHHLESINTVYRAEDGWRAASTDGEGFAQALTRLHTPLRGFKRIVFMGNGGAALSVLDYISREFESEVETVILRRDAAKDDLITYKMPDNFHLKFLDFSPGELEREVKGCGGETLVIQATSAPLYGQNLLSFASALDDFNGVFVDMVYGKPSALLKKAQERGLPCQDGIPMLIEQARLSQKLWWGSAVSYEEISQLL